MWRERVHGTARSQCVILQLANWQAGLWRLRSLFRYDYVPESPGPNQRIMTTQAAIPVSESSGPAQIPYENSVGCFRPTTNIVMPIGTHKNPASSNLMAEAGTSLLRKGVLSRYRVWDSFRSRCTVGILAAESKLKD